MSNRYVLLTTLVCSACTSSEWKDEPVLRGRVVEVGTRAPIAGAHVNAAYRVVETDARGFFELAVREDSAYTVTARHLWFAGIDSVVVPRSSMIEPIDLQLMPLEPPCCELRGRWRITLHLAPTARDKVPGVGPAFGWLSFHRRHRRFLAGARSRYEDPPGPYEPARAGIDWTPIWPKRPRLTEERVDSLVVALGWQEAMEYVDWLEGGVGWVHHDDSVTIYVPPIGSHSGYGLLGTIAGDQVSGDWIAGAYGPDVGGRFVMVRTGR